MHGVVWQKSSYSNEGVNCVNVAAAPTRTALLRESDAPETVLTTTPAALRALLGAIKRGPLAGR
jgi:hypothetical protein